MGFFITATNAEKIQKDMVRERERADKEAAEPHIDAY